MSNESIIFSLVFVVVAILLYVLYRKNFKRIKTPSVALITGGVKTGKSLLAVNLSVKKFKKVHLVWWFQSHLLRRDIEEPYYYTNAYVSFGKSRRMRKFSERCIKRLSLDALLRKERFNYKSVIYIQEASLMADNMDFKNVDRNIDLSLFAKLIAHETRGGQLYLDTQSVLDVHYAFKRVASTYLFIQKDLNFKLFHVLYVREMINTENGVNNFESDVDDTMRKVLIPCWWHGRYDRYEYSYLTDELDCAREDFKPCAGLVSFNPKYRERAKGGRNDEETK